jgi:hypothetical protein
MNNVPLKYIKLCSPSFLSSSFSSLFIDEHMTLSVSLSASFHFPAASKSQSLLIETLQATPLQRQLRS